MRLKVTAGRIFAVVALGVVAGLLGAAPAQANCQNGSVVSWSAGNFTGCGDNAEAFFWVWRMGTQRKTANNTVAINNAAGNDSGNVPGSALLVTAGLAPGDYGINTDWSVPGVDGCITDVGLKEADAGNCVGDPGSFPPMNYIIAGRNPSDPTQALAAALSVDYLECTSYHEFGQAGLAAGDGDQCLFDQDCFNVAGVNVQCGEIPRPRFATLGNCTAAGCTHTLTTAAPGTVAPIVDDCQTAYSRAITTGGTVPYGANCPAGGRAAALDGGLLLMFRRDACDAILANMNTHAFAVLPATGTAANIWTPFSSEDANLNGILDAGEDGTHGGTANGVLDPVIFSRTAPDSKDVFVSAIPLATDCLYFATAMRVDPTPLLALTIQHEQVLSPYVSMNGNPVHLDAATPASDRVINLVASKTSGKASVSWDTTAELSTAGFNLIGTKKNGGSVQLNSSLIPAKQGTTGQGASYSASLGGSDLKGSTAVYIELVKTNGAKERFGPASF